MSHFFIWLLSLAELGQAISLSVRSQQSPFLPRARVDEIQSSTVALFIIILFLIIVLRFPPAATCARVID